MILQGNKDVYNIKFFGACGNIGKGDNIEILYLQSSLDMKQIEQIKLIGELPGSEKWKIADLFQRQIDYDRIDGPNGLINYFRNPNKVKFFNPITMVILPFKSNNVDVNIDKLVRKENIELFGTNGTLHEKEEYFRLFTENKGSSGVLEINQDYCDIVALDGQHRLAALKSIYSFDRHKNSEVCNWKIPVIFIICDEIDQNSSKRNYIQVLRNIFTYINMEAKTINDSRAILLNDESLVCIGVQEIIEKVHSLDGKQDDNYIPLYLFDWVGEDNSNNNISIINNVEIKNIISNYLIGDDSFKNKGKIWKELELNEIELDFVHQRSNKLTQKDIKKIRKQYNKDFCPAFIDFFTNLEPINSIIKDWINIEKKAINEDEYAYQAFDIYKYGYNKREKPEEIERARKSYLTKLKDVNNKYLTDFMKEDIWLRGLFSALGMLKSYYYDKIYNPILTNPTKLPWTTLVSKFNLYFNKFINEKWCLSYSEFNEIEGGKEKQELLTNICHSKNEKRINYRFSDVNKAWGIFVLMTVLHYAEQDDSSLNDLKFNIWEDIKDNLRSTLEKGFKTDAQDITADEPLSINDRIHKIDDLKKMFAMKRINKLCVLWGLDIEYQEDDIKIIQDKYDYEY